LSLPLEAIVLSILSFGGTLRHHCISDEVEVFILDVTSSIYLHKINSCISFGTSVELTLALFCSGPGAKVKKKRSRMPPDS